MKIENPKMSKEELLKVIKVLNFEIMKDSMRFCNNCSVWLNRSKNLLELEKARITFCWDNPKICIRYKHIDSWKD